MLQLVGLSAAHLRSHPRCTLTQLVNSQAFLGEFARAAAGTRSAALLNGIRPEANAGRKTTDQNIDKGA